MNHRSPTLRIQNSLKWLLFGLSLFLASVPAIAKLNLSGVTNVNVTSSGFSIIGDCSSVIDSNTVVSVSVFSDAGGVTNLAGQLGLEFYPLNTGNPGATNNYDRRLNQNVLRQDSMKLGLIYVRVTGCAPNTTYYYSVQVSNTNGQAVWPANGPLPAVTTAIENAFVLQSEQLVISLGGTSPAGAIVLLSTTNTPTVLAAVVGDGAATNQVFFSINELIAAAGNTNVLPNGTQEFTATVRGLPSLSVTQTYSLDFSTNFEVAGGANFSLGSFVALAIGSNAVLVGQGGSIPIQMLAATFVTNFSFTLSIPTNRFNSLALQPLVSQFGSASLTPSGSNALRVAFVAAPGQSFQGNQEIAQLNFVTASNQNSAFVPIIPQNLQGTNTDATVVNLTALKPGRLVIVGQQSLLEALRAPDGSRNLALYGHPGASYQVQASADPSKPANWNNLMRVPLTNIVETFPLNSSPSPAFYRAYEFTSLAPILDVGPAVNGVVTIVVYGTPWLAYEVDTANSLSFPLNWKLLSRLPFTNSFQILRVNSSGAALFYRTHTLNADPPLLEAHLQNQNRSLMVYGLAGTNYTLQTANSLSNGASWSSALSFNLTNSFQLLTNVGNAQPVIFYRLKKP